MNRSTYRKAFDEIPFSPDFQARTADLLRSHAQETKLLEKEHTNMKLKLIRKPAVLIAAAALLIVSASAAAILWRSPAQVAEGVGQPLLAEAFESEDAVLLNETVETGDFNVTLLGLVSGAGLSSWEQDVDASHTYAVVGLSRLDGTPLEDETFDFISYTLTPLVAGYSPRAVNNWTLQSFATGFDADGNYYYLLDTQDLRIFADHTVYLAFYEGGAPGNGTFYVAEDGSISFAEDFDGVQALFTLPLDASLADPAAADAFAEGTGLNIWSNERAAEPENTEFVSIRETEDGVMVIAGEDGDASAGADKVWYSTAAFKTYMSEETAELQKQLEDGVLTQEDYDKAVAELEETLAGLEDGSLIAVETVGEDGAFTIIPKVAGTEDLDVQYQIEDGYYMMSTETQMDDGTDDTAKYGSHIITEDGAPSADDP